MSSLGLDVSDVLPKVLELLHGGSEGHDLVGVGRWRRRCRGRFWGRFGIGSSAVSSGADGSGFISGFRVGSAEGSWAGSRHGCGFKPRVGWTADVRSGAGSGSGTRSGGKSGSMTSGQLMLRTRIQKINHTTITIIK